MSSWLDFVIFDNDNFSQYNAELESNSRRHRPSKKQILDEIAQLLHEIESRAEKIESLLIELQSKGEL